MARLVTISRDGLAKGLSIHPRTLDRAYTGDPECFYSRNDQQYDLATIAAVLNADPKFLLDCTHGRDRALKRREIKKLLSTDYTTVRLITAALAIISPAVQYGTHTLRYSANAFSSKRTTPPKTRRVSCSRHAHAEGGAV